jgi:hypothetical protein
MMYGVAVKQKKIVTGRLALASWNFLYFYTCVHAGMVQARRSRHIASRPPLSARFHIMARSNSFFRVGSTDVESI